VSFAHDQVPVSSATVSPCSGSQSPGYQMRNVVWPRSSKMTSW
jgi:hypothetical protein